MTFTDDELSRFPKMEKPTTRYTWASLNAKDDGRDVTECQIMPQRLFKPLALVITGTDSNTRLLSVLVGADEQLLCPRGDGVPGELYDPATYSELRELAELHPCFKQGLMVSHTIKKLGDEPDPDADAPPGIPPFEMATLNLGNMLCVQIKGRFSGCAVWGKSIF